MSDWQPFDVDGVRAFVTGVTLARRGTDTPPMVVEIVDEGVGGYLTISDGESSINLDPDEWPALQEVITRLLPLCAPVPPKETR